MRKEDIQNELEFFFHVEEVISEKLAVLLENKTALKSDVISVRSNMWEENRHLIRDFDDVILLSTQDRDVATSEAQYSRNEMEIRRLARMKESPYFGRLDFSEGVERVTEKIYVGIYSLNKEDGFELYITDWRAPIASLYYNYDLGSAQYEVAGSYHNVDISLKRQYKIENGKLLVMYDTDSAMYDEVLGGILSQKTNNNLKVIISSIQKEQNNAIRSEVSRSCLIYGMAGSGKTSVGLHRIAYILYHERHSIKAENILIISNNTIFCSYISRILPDLGEETAQNAVFSEMLSKLIGQKYKIEDYYDQQKAIGIQENTNRINFLKIKYSREFLDYCKYYFENFSFKIPEVKYNGRVIVCQQSFYQKWGQRSFSSFKAKYDAAMEVIKRTIEDYFVVNRDEIYEDIKSTKGVFLTASEVSKLYKKIIKKYVSAVQKRIDLINRLTPEEQLVFVINSYLQQQGMNTDEVERLKTSFSKRELLYEDANLYLYVKLLMGETMPIQTIRHVVVDEAQDYSLAQFYIIKLLFPKSCFTLLADMYQAINKITTMHEYEMFDAVFGTNLTKICLDRCYRSSKEINELAFQVIRDNNELTENYSYFDRSVKLPEYIISDNPVASISAIINKLEKYNTIAIITNDERQAIWVGAQLPLAFDAHLITSPAASLQSRVNVLPLMLAKGLEFDAVVLLYPCTSNVNKEYDLRKLYLGCTRALHELYIIERNHPPINANWSTCIEIKNGSENNEENSIG